MNLNKEFKNKFQFISKSIKGKNMLNHKNQKLYNKKRDLKRKSKIEIAEDLNIKKENLLQEK